jgi:hypothetical protein
MVGFMKRVDSNSGFSAVEIVMVIALFTCIGLAGWYIWNNNQNTRDSDASTQDVARNSSTPTPTPEDNYTPAELRTVNLEKYGTVLKIPSDWEEVIASDNTTYRIQDKSRDIEFTLTVSKDNATVGPSCNRIAKASEEITYDNPLPGQRTVTKLTFTSIAPETKTLCGIMITGSYEPKINELLDTRSAEFLAAVPNNKFSVYVSKISSSIQYPLISDVDASPRYAELIAVLKSIQVK